MNALEKIRAALEIADRKTDVFDAAKAALAELERASKEPVATVCLITDRFAHGHCIEAQLQVDPTAQLPVGTKLYTTPPPAPVAAPNFEAVKVTDEVARRVSATYGTEFSRATFTSQGHAMIAAVQSELGPTLGLVPPAGADARIAKMEEKLAAMGEDAERYRWLRRRIRLTNEQMMSGAVKKCLTVRIAYSALERTDDPAESYLSQDRFNAECAALDVAIDEARTGNGESGDAVV